MTRTDSDRASGNVRDATLPGEREAVLRAVLQNMEQGVVVIDGRLRVAAANQTVLDWFGIARKDHPDGIAYAEVMRRIYRAEGLSDRDARARVSRELADPDHFAARTYRRTLPTGRTFEVRQTPLPDGGAVRLYTDITDRMATHAALEASRSKAIEATRLLADALDHSVDGFVVWDCDGRLAIWNTAYERMMAPMADMLQTGLPLVDFVASAVRRGLLAREAGEADDEAILRWLDRLKSETTYEHQTSRNSWILSTNRFSADGSLIWTRTDISELKDRETRRADQARRLEDLSRHLDIARRDAEAANRAKSRFLAQVSHELRTPLNAVLGFSELMRTEYFGALGHSKYIGYAEDIHDAGSHLLEVINQILDLARVESGRMEIDPQNLSVIALVQDSVKLVAPLAQTGRIRLRAEIPEISVWADRRLARQALVNILGNAIKFTGPDGDVILEAHLDGGWTAISVRDTGAGMTPQEVEMALEPFGRVEMASARPLEGTGLGLPLVTAFLKLHGGRVEIRSEKGRGTTVLLHFPPAPTTDRADPP
jgi:signal transduction histidine kinase